MDYENATTALSKARAAVEEASREADAISEIIGNKAETIRVNTESAINKLGDEAAATVTQQAQAAKEEFEAVIAREGANASSSLKASFEGLNRILSDNIPDENQLQEIANIAALAKGAREASNNKIIAGFADLAAGDKALNTRLDTILKQLKEGRLLRE